MKFIHYKADAAATLFVAISLAILPGAALAKGNHHPNHPGWKRLDANHWKHVVRRFNHEQSRHYNH